MLIYGIIITLSGLSLALWPNRRARAVETRIAQGDDSYFEEQRAYNAYPWLRNPRRLRIAGFVSTAGGLIVCAIEFWHG